MLTLTSKRRWLILSFTWTLAAFSILPIIFHWTAPPPSTSHTRLAIVLAYLAVALLCYLFYRQESKNIGRAQAFVLILLIFLQTHFALYTHRYLVDRATTFSLPSNTSWQQNLQDAVIHLSPAVLPHSYRFLPNALVYLLQIFRVRFDQARDIYQLLAGIFLFYALYRYARLYTSYRGAILAMLFSGLVYPISFVGHAGQLTDPLSHLSFILAFIFIEAEDFSLLLTTLLIGSLAKETVLALSGFYLLFRSREKQYLLKSAVLFASGFLVYFGVRLYVLHGSMQYHQVSNVSLSQVSANLHDPPWPIHLLITVGAYVPFLFLSWKQTPSTLKQMALYLFPVLFISSLFFSWLNETRNFMPLVFVLAVIAGRYFDALPSSPEPLPAPL